MLQLRLLLILLLNSFCCLQPWLSAKEFSSSDSGGIYTIRSIQPLPTRLYLYLTPMERLRKVESPERLYCSSGDAGSVCMCGETGALVSLTEGNMVSSPSGNKFSLEIEAATAAATRRAWISRLSRTPC